MEVGEHRPGSGRPEGDTEAAAALTLSHAAGCTTRTVYCCSKIGTAERWIFGGADRRFDHCRMLAHAEMIVRIPNWF